MKYSILALFVLALISCNKTENCHECVFTTTYLLKEETPKAPPVYPTSTSYKKQLCDEDYEAAFRKTYSNEELNYDSFVVIKIVSSNCY